MDGFSMFSADVAAASRPVHLISEIRRLSDELAAAAAPNEAIFLALGDALAQARLSFLSLDGQFERFSTLAHSQRIEEATALLSQVVAQHAPLARSDQKITEHLQEIARGTAGVVRPLNDLLKISTEIKTLAVNAKVEAAHISSDTVDFSVFTSDIGRMGALAEAAIAKGTERLAALRGIVDQALKIQSDATSMDRHELAAVQTSGERRLSDFKRWRERSQTAVRELAVSRNQIAVEVAACVELLQVNDMTAQRIAHCGAALHFAGGLLAGESGEDLAWAAEFSQSQRMAPAAVLCRLQAHQLERAAVDFCAAVVDLKTRLSKLAREAAAAENAAFENLGSDEGAGGVCAALRVDGERVLAALDDSTRLSRQVRAKVGALLAGLEELAGDMAGIRSVDADMRLMGLNAGLKCERLAAKGRALAVVAQELRAGSRRTDAALRMIGADTHTVRQAAWSLEAAADERTGQATEVGPLLRRWIDAVAQIGGDLDEALAPIRLTCQQTRAVLGEAAAGIQIDDRLGNDCRRIADRLKIIADEIHPETPDDKAVVAQLLSLLKDHYTMASERVIHALFSEDGGAVAALTADDDDVFL